MKTKDAALLNEAWEGLFASPLVARSQEADIVRAVCGHDAYEVREKYFHIYLYPRALKSIFKLDELP